MTYINEVQISKAVKDAFWNPSDQTVDTQNIKDNTSRIYDLSTIPVLPYGMRQLQIQIQEQEKG